MKGKWTILGSILAVLLLTLAAGLTNAQGPQPPAQGAQPQGGVGVQSALGTAFTYQGQLKKNGNPVNDNCDFLFSLWDAATEGSQVGSNQEKTNVPVSNGLFTVQLDFGAGAFQGDARWLRIRVRCPTGIHDYSVLDPRQPLTPVPYALALPGLRTQQNTTSPNLIGGYSGNGVTDGVVGATIGGGGLHLNTNRVTDLYGTVGGGVANQAGSDDGDTANATATTVGGGSTNVASGETATVGGGFGNTARARYSTVSGGYGNDALGEFATVGGGENNLAVGDDTTIGGGWCNEASGAYATVPGGVFAKATHYGEIAYAAGQFGGFSLTCPSAGDAQTSLYVMRIERTCTAGTWYDLYLNGNDTPSEFLTIAPGRTVAFDALVVGRSNDDESAAYQIRGLVENAAGTLSVKYMQTVLGEDDPNWDVKAITGFGALVIQVQGNGENIRWVASVRTAEVAW